jgi:hypothetical protein
VVTKPADVAIEVDAAEAVAAFATATLTSIALEAVDMADPTLWQRAWDTFVAMSATQQLVGLLCIRDHVVEAMLDPEHNVVVAVVWLPLLVIMIRAMKVTGDR